MKKEIIKFLIFILLLIILYSLGKTFKLNLDSLKTYFEKYNFFISGIIFVILYVVVTFFIWLSKDIFRLISAIIFGAEISTVLIFIAETINAVVLFYFSRILGKEFVEKNIFKEKTTSYKNILEKKKSFFWLLLLRITPFVPFRFMDLFMGLIPIQFRRYLLVVVLGSPLRIYWLQFILASLGVAVFRQPTELLNFLLSHKIIFIITLIYVILVIILGIKFISKRR